MHLRRARQILLVVGVLGGATVAGSAGAQTSNKDVAAEALFEDARALVAAGKDADACPKFAESQRLSPSAATLLNLANCWEKLGRTATAWATYREAASAADAAGRKDYVLTAQRRADGLSTKLARLTVTVAQPVPGLQVLRDGVGVDAPEWGAGIPVDTGAHTIDASAPGRKPWSTTINVAQDGSQSSAAVPLLEELAPSESPPPAPTAASPRAAATVVPAVLVPADTPVPAAPPPGGGTQRVLGAVGMGIGVAGLGAGAILAGLAKSKYNDSLDNCEKGSPDLCTETGVSQRNDARSLGDGATVALSVGAAVLVAGGILWFTAPSAAREKGMASFEIAPTWGGFVARGAW